MTLLTKTTLLYLLVALLVFGLGTIIGYHKIKQVVEKETDYFLVENYIRLVKSIKEGQPLGALVTEKVSIEPLSVAAGANIDTSAVFADTTELHYYWKRPEPHRLLTKVTNIEGKLYRISLMDVIVESDDVYKGVIYTLTTLFAVLSAALMLFGIFIGRQLLKPFYQTLASIRTFNVKKDDDAPLIETNTKEFRQLNAFVYSMKDRARRDYRALKEFTENASHEMQTPVAIAKGKLELLLESENLSERQMQLIHAAHDSVNRLSRISHGLALLNKIDNEEFAGVTPIDFSEVVSRSVDHYEELAYLKGITIEKKIRPNIMLPVDINLAEILIGNLIKNAIHHNMEDGWIEIKLDEHQLQIRNSGQAPNVETSQLFERFRKGNQSTGSLGLGLAIVKKICTVNHWEIDYQYQEKAHQLEVDFV